jgi:Carboxypeptidase regulatory-like domain
MTKKQAAALEMFQAVLAHFNSNQTLIENFAAITEARATLAEKLNALADALQVQGKVITGITLRKKHTRELLTDDIVILANALFAFANVTGNEELQKTAAISFSALNRMKDAVLNAYCRNLLDAMIPHQKALTGFGIEQDMITTLNAKVDAWYQNNTQTRNAVSMRVAGSKELKLIFAGISQLLRMRIDPLMLQFKKTEPAFYNSYRNNRKMRAPIITSTQLSGKVRSSKDKKALAGAEIQVWNGGSDPVATAYSNREGNYRIPQLPNGNFTVRVKKGDTTVDAATDVTILLGQVNRLDLVVELV